MTTAEHRLGDLPAPGRHATGPGAARRIDAGARRRLAWSILWLAALVVWGLLSHTAPWPMTDGDVAAPTFDGRGKWTGY